MLRVARSNPECSREPIWANHYGQLSNHAINNGECILHRISLLPYNLPCADTRTVQCHCLQKCRLQMRQHSSLTRTGRMKAFVNATIRLIVYERVTKWNPPIMWRQKGHVGGATLPFRHSSEAHSPAHVMATAINGHKLGRAVADLALWRSRQISDQQQAHLSHVPRKLHVFFLKVKQLKAPEYHMLPTLHHYKCVMQQCCANKASNKKRLADSKPTHNTPSMEQTGVE